MYKMNKEYHINAYRLQYWLYAILNKKYGKELEFVRDPLHNHYAVNRHGFMVKAKNINLKEIQDWLSDKLLECCYKKRDKDWSGMFSKKTEKETGNEELCVSISIQSNVNIRNNKPYLYILPLAYWTKKQKNN